MTQEKAIKLAREYLNAHPDPRVIDEPIVRFIPAKFRPEIDAKNGAWLITFRCLANPDMITHPADALVILVDTVTGEISLPKRL